MYKQSTAWESGNPTRGSGPPLGNCVISRAGIVHRPGMAEFHAVESSIARESQNPRARVVHCPGMAEFHAVESSIARE